jgi:hypothetical protein
MLGSYFYHEIIKKTVIAFGSLFKNIEIHHIDDAHDKNISIIKVPIAYGPIQKFLSRINQQPNFNKESAITLPRLSFEIISYRYNSTRKASIIQKFCASTPNDKTKIKQVFMPVPYDIGFRLSFASKLQDDALQILEQILPLFQPALNITVNLIDSIGEYRDIPIILNNISFMDEYEGNYDTRRFIRYDLDFTAQVYFYNEVPTDSNGGLIKKVQVDYSSQFNAPREVRYSVTPKATKDYNQDKTDYLIEKFEINKTLLKVVNGSSFQVGEYIQIDSETMKINQIDQNNLIVSRGEYGTKVVEHFAGTSINAITIEDDALIEDDDDFGFNSTITDFNNSKTFSPSLGIDV